MATALTKTLPSLGALNITGTLADLWRHYADQDRSRFGMRLGRDERSEHYPASIIAIVKDKRHLILTAPINANNVLMPIAKEEVWFCQLFNATTVFSFKSRVLKVAYDPVPHVHMELPKSVERRMMRKQPRAAVSLAAMLHSTGGDAAVVVDLSIAGARIAVRAATKLAVNTVVPMFVNIAMLDQLFPLKIDAKVSTDFGVADSKYPDVRFYGVQFKNLDETTRLVLHGYVHEQLADELNRQSRAPAIEAVYASSMEAWLNNG